MNQNYRTAMSRLVCLALLALATSTTVCAQKKSAGGTRAADREAIRSLFEEHVKGIQAGEASRVAATFTKDADSIIHRSTRRVGRTEIRQATEKMLKESEDVTTIQYKIANIRFLSPNVAILDVDYRFSSHRDRGSHVLVRTAGKWLIAAFRVFPAEESKDEASDR